MDDLLTDAERERLATDFMGWNIFERFSPTVYLAEYRDSKDIFVMSCHDWLTDLSSPEAYYQVNLLLDKLRSMYFVHIIAFGTGFSVSVEVNGDYVAAEGENLNEVIIRAILEVIGEQNN